MPDDRSKREKLEALANHPRTPKTEADAARRALRKLAPEALDARPADGQIRYADAQPSRPRSYTDDLAEAVRRAQDAAEGRAPGGRTTGPRPFSFDPGPPFGPNNRTYQSGRTTGPAEPPPWNSYADILSWAREQMARDPNLAEAVRRRYGVDDEGNIYARPDAPPVDFQRRAREAAYSRPSGMPPEEYDRMYQSFYGAETKSAAGDRSAYVNAMQQQVREREARREALWKQRMSPETCPGCGHRGELHSGGICYQCESRPAPGAEVYHCRWHYETGFHAKWVGFDMAADEPEPTFDYKIDDDGNAYLTNVGWFEKEQP